jgi:hypothetical protein
MKRLPRKPTGSQPAQVAIRQIIEYLESVEQKPAPNSLTSVTTRGTFTTPKPGGGGAPSTPSGDAVWQ